MKNKSTLLLSFAFLFMRLHNYYRQRRFCKKNVTEMSSIAKKSCSMKHLASDFYETLNITYPYAKNSENNRVLGIYSYFMDRNYVQAFADSEYFLQMYPRSSYADWTLFMQSYSAFSEHRGAIQDFMGMDRARNDLSRMQVSYALAQRLIDLYPKSKYVPAAVELQHKINAVSARLELDVANYYFQQEAYIAAIKRCSKIIEKYPTSCQAPPALKILKKSYAKLGLSNWAKDIKK